MASHSSEERRDNAVNQVVAQLDECMAHWRTQIESLTELRDRLVPMNQRLCYDIKVPFGNFAFMEGKLVDTNKVIVPLGDGWYAERSCHQAVQFIDRKIKRARNCIMEIEERKCVLVKRLQAFQHLTELVDEHSEIAKICEFVVTPKERTFSEVLDSTGGKKRRIARTAPKDKKLAVNNPLCSQAKPIDQDYVTAMARLDELQKAEEDEDVDGDANSEARLFAALKSSQTFNLATTICRDSDTTKKGVRFAAEEEADLDEDSIEVHAEEERGKEELSSKKIINEDANTGFSSAPKSILRNRDERTLVDSKQMMCSAEPQTVILPMSSQVFTGQVSERGASSPQSKATTVQHSSDPEEPKTNDRPISKFKQRKLPKSDVLYQ